MDEKQIVKHKRKKRLCKREQKNLIIAGLLGTAVLLLLLILILNIFQSRGQNRNSQQPKTIETSAESKNQEKQSGQKGNVPSTEKQEVQAQLIAEADRLAAGYDYDKAIEKIKGYEGYEAIPELKAAVSRYETDKAACVPVNINEVTHIFYHSLVVDPQRAFANQDNDRQEVGNNQWMTTIEEFNKITQSMYERGYVLVNLHDIAAETVDENGTKHFAPGTILLPPGKKAYVLSLDDLSYYHAYDGYGFASRLVLDESGKPKCEYIQPDGTTVVGDYDVVPILDRFLEEHPDAAYRGAKGTIALTGYNGVLGYRTDISYQTRPDDLDAVKQKWLEQHPEFDLETERAKAKAVASAMKAEGWSFASHTWGHLAVGSISLERLQADTQKWKENVEPVVGSTDTIIFAHGEDLTRNWPHYEADNEKFLYLKSQGYDYFCNVDSRQYGVVIQDNYVRQSRRNLDGYRIYYNAVGQMDSVSDLFDAASVLDPARPPVKPLG